MPTLASLEGHTFRDDCLSPSSVVLDFGMNQGKFAMGINELVGARVWGLEPVPSLFAQILNLRGVEDARPWAITGNCGEVELTIHQNVCASTFKFADVSDRIVVPCVDLETVFSEWRLSSVDLVKVDIEGSEFGLFASASDEILNSIRQITIEFHDFIWPERRPEVDLISKRLKSLGFQRLSFALNNGDILFLGSGLHLNLFERIRLMAKHKYIPGFVRVSRRSWKDAATRVRRSLG